MESIINTSLNRFLLHFSFILSVTLILLTGCSQHTEEESSLQIPEQYFNTELAEKQFNQLNNEEQWGFVFELIKTPYKNTVDVQNWLLNKWEEKAIPFNLLKEEDLRKLNENLYQSNYSEFAETIAHFTLHSEYGKKNKKAHIMAAVLLATKYNLLKQKDSLAHYLNIMENEINIETKNWLSVIYYTNKANLADLNSQFFKAAVNYHKAIELADKTDTLNIGKLYMNLANMYLNMEYFDKALHYANKVIDIVGKKNLELNELNTLGVILYRSGDLITAEKTYEEVLQRALDKNLNSLLAQTYSNYGNLKIEQHKYEEALTFYNISDSICQKLNIPIGLYINQVNRSNVYFKKNNYLKALKEFSKAEKLSLNFDIPKFNTELFKLMSDVHQALGNQTLSDKYFRRHILNKEKYIGDTPKSFIIEWELGKEQELRIIETAALSLSLEKQTKKNYLTAFILILFLMISILFFIRRNQKITLQKQKIKLEKKSMEFEMESKSKELLLYSLKEISLQNTKDWLKEELDLITNELPAAHKNKLSALKHKLKNQSKEKFLEEFETRFLGVYEEFYKKLIAVAPNLTINELRICSLIRLNFSTKEISHITNLHKGTIDNTRSLIRKKMKLDDKNGLKEFLKEF